MKKQVCISILIALISPPVFGDDYIEENIAHIEDGVDVIVAAKYTMNKSALCNGVVNALDGASDTVWCTRIRENEWYMKPTPASFKMSFTEDVYLSSVYIASGCGEGDHGVIEDIFVEPLIVEPQLWDLSVGPTMRNSVSKQRVYEIDESTRLLRLFPMKALRINIASAYNKERVNEVCVRDIDIKFNKSLKYTPQSSLEHIKQYIYSNSNAREIMDAGNGNWKFYKQSVVKSKRSEMDDRKFVDLAYYAMRGDEESIKLFFSANPYNEGKLGLMNDIFKPAMKEFLQKRSMSAVARMKSNVIQDGSR